MTTRESQPTKPIMPESHKIKVYSNEYFAYCALGGALACGPTHALMTPIDLVKCNSQTDTARFGRGVIPGMRSIMNGSVSELGFRSGFPGLWRGVMPTFGGYSLQGLGKYGGYEYFAYQYSRLVGPEIAEGQYRPLIWMGASATAEFFADLLLCPFEAVKVRVQTQPKYAIGLTDGLSKMLRTEGLGGLYAGLVPLWCRQIPYTVVKFTSFEAIADQLFAVMPKKKADMSQAEQLGVVFSAGYLAGILCATISHPADILVSKVNSVSSQGSFVSKAKLIYSGNATQPGIGFKGLWVGLPARIVMIGTLTGLQWFLYGAFKQHFGLPAPGGH